MKKITKKWCSFVLIAVMVFGMSTTFTFANSTTKIETDMGELTVTQLSDTKYLMSDGEDCATMELTTVDENTKITIDEGNKEYYFYINKDNDTIYSSITGEVTDLSDISAVVATGTGKRVSQKTYKISYAKIASAVGTTASLYSYAVMIVTIIAATQGIGVVTATAFIMSTLREQLLDQFLNGVKHKYANHGIKVIVGTYEYTKHHGGAIAHGFQIKVDSVSLY